MKEIDRFKTKINGVEKMIIEIIENNSSESRVDLDIEKKIELKRLKKIEEKLKKKIERLFFAMLISEFYRFSDLDL